MSSSVTLALIALACLSTWSETADAGAIGKIHWRFHAWNPTTKVKIETHNGTAYLPESEELAIVEICRALSSLPSEAHLLALSSSAFHAALNSFCQTFNVTCVFLDALEGERVPDEWQHNAIRFYPAPELRSRSIYEFIAWSMWGDFAVFYEEFHDLDKVQSLLNYPLGPTIFRPINLSSGRALHEMQRLGQSTLHRFVVHMSTKHLPSFFRLARAAGITGMAHSFLLIAELSDTFFNRHVAHSLNQGINFTTHQFDGVRFIGDSLNKPALSRTDALETLLNLAYKAWLADDPPAIAASRTLELSGRTRCQASLPDRVGEFHRFLENEIRTRIGFVFLDGVKHYNFSFAVHHMSRQENALQPHRVANVKFAEWTASEGYRITNQGSGIDEFHFKRSMNELNISVVTVIEPPFSMKVDFDQAGKPLTGNDRWTGLAVELFKEAARRLNISYTIDLSSDGQYGAPKEGNADEPQVWSGMVGDLMTGRADVAVASLVITYDRERVIDFTTPYMSMGLSVIMKKPEERRDPLQFMQPFGSRVWICMLLAWLLTSLLMLVCARLSPYEWYSHSDCVPVVENQFGALNSMWFTIGSLMQQGSDLAPRASSTRMVATTWWFFTLLLISSYTANLAAFLTSSRLANINSVDALAGQSKVKFGCPTGGAMYNFFKTSRIQLYRRMWDSMVAWSATNESFVRKTAEGISRVRQGGYAYIMESTFNKYYRERDCELTQIGGIFNPGSYAFAVRQGNAFLRRQLGEVILQLHQEQFIEQLSDNWITRFNNTGGTSCDKESSESAPDGTLDVVSFGGVFVSMLVGLAIAVVLCFAELLWSCGTLALRTRRSFSALLMEHLRLAVKLSVNSRSLSPAPPPCACATAVSDWNALPLEALRNGSEDHSVGLPDPAAAEQAQVSEPPALEAEPQAMATESPELETGDRDGSSSPVQRPLIDDETLPAELAPAARSSDNDANDVDDAEEPLRADTFVVEAIVDAEADDFPSKVKQPRERCLLS